ncbi:GNAT family N-acetyltransferase [Aurantimonas sp. A2-1-M11]|uniref:GNAT family N-acetyltransferase n=1 Tax=Aurantimonas sp. A2-1-M11 TaxID=3113712 RepID=UPI002F94E27B
MSGQPTQARWRAMKPGDLRAAIDLADRVHPGLPEEEAVFADRLRLFPAGCLVLEDAAGGVAGYAIAHPWTEGAPPKLDTVLGTLPQPADRFFIHDVVVAPEMRGQGLAAPAVERLLEEADTTYASAALVSVYGTVPFWTRFGFVEAPDALPDGALAAYGRDARFMIRRCER